MAAKSPAEIAQVLAKATADAAAKPEIKTALDKNHLRVLSQAPYNLTLDDLVAAHDSNPGLRAAAPSWRNAG